MAGNNAVQIPFSGFKRLDLGKSVSLRVYQSLYDDHCDPVGLAAVVHAVGMILPSDKAIEKFKQKWKSDARRWQIHETTIEMVTGKSTTSEEISKISDGEAALMVMSFLIEGLREKTVSDVARKLVDSATQGTRLRPAQISNVVKAIQSQTSCVSWKQDIKDAEDAVLERPTIWRHESTTPRDSFDLHIDALAAFYRALCTVSRFDEYHCVVQTECSLTVPYVLAHTICGLRVCVIINGNVVHGCSTPGSWRVLLEKYDSGPTRVKLGKSLDDVEGLLVIDKLGSIRSNRVPINGIGRNSTEGQGLELAESEDVASLAIAAAISTLSKWDRQLLDDRRGYESSLLSGSDPSTASESSSVELEGTKHVPVKVRLTTQNVMSWWGCSNKNALQLLKNGDSFLENYPKGAPWAKLSFPKTITGKIVEFEGMDEEEQTQRRLKWNCPFDRHDYSRLVHMLTTQLILMAFLSSNDETKDKIRVRSTWSPNKSSVGRAIRGTKKPDPLGHSDVMYSWYSWIHGITPKYPKGTYGMDVLTADGYLIYRSLLLELCLSPGACESVTVEPGHLVFQDYRPTEVRGPEIRFSNFQAPYYKKELRGLEKLRSQDHTGELTQSWNVREEDESLELEMVLQNEKHGLKMTASVYEISKCSWNLMYGDRSLGCKHEEERVGTLMDNETLVVVSAGKLEEGERNPWKPLILSSAHGNDIGQIACLLSVPYNFRGMVRREACLRCCITAAQKLELDFVID